MKNKKCEYCGKVMDYEEWKSMTLSHSEWHWKVKRFCDNNCKTEYNNKKNRGVK